MVSGPAPAPEDDLFFTLDKKVKRNKSQNWEVIVEEMMKTHKKHSLHFLILQSDGPVTSKCLRSALEGMNGGSVLKQKHFRCVIIIYMYGRNYADI